jgi:hypothetical protein
MINIQSITHFNAYNQVVEDYKYLNSCLGDLDYKSTRAKATIKCTELLDRIIQNKAILNVCIEADLEMRELIRANSK